MVRRSAPLKTLDLAALRGLLRGLDRRASPGERVAAASRTLLGRPYRACPLVGSAATPEVFCASLAGFDCVSYVETAFALALSRDPRQFLDWLRRIRYRGGVVAWRRRHHYLTGWIAANARAGLLRRVHLPGPEVVRARRLDAVPGLPPRRLQLRCLPKRAFWRVRDAVRDGDILCFASTKRNLDVFHAGIAAWSGGELRLWHAARSRGRVVEQDLAGFLADNTMAGVIVARPVEAHGRLSRRGRRTRPARGVRRARRES